MRVNKGKFLKINLALSVMFILSYMLSNWFLWTDAEYVDSLQLPTDADSLGIPVIGGFITGIFLLVMCLVYYKVLADKTRQKSKINTFGWWDGLSFSGSKIAVAIKYALAFILVLIVFKDLYGYQFINTPLFIFEVMLYLSLLASGIGNLSILTGLYAQDGRASK